MNIVMLESLAVSEDILKSYIKPLEEAGHTFRAYEKSSDEEVLKEESKDADILILANMPLRQEVIRNCSHLKFIDVAFTGVDHVDLEAAKEMGAALSNASGYSNESVAELTLGMILSLLRNVPQVEARCRDGKTKDGLVGFELKGKTVGIIGTGAIGMRTAQLCSAFGCKVIAYNGFSKKENSELITYMPLKDLLEEADIVALHCPLTEQSRHLINQETIGYMKKSAILINAARGPVVDSDTLAKALNEGRIAGAGIDVFEVEPPLNTDHPLLHAKNTIVTPHVAFATKESMEIRAEIVFRNIDQWLKGEQINKIL
ncbi:2-hydroxyacid dehydrogenase [Robinsoniella peoriensis]|uniref:2-hydroxyacid dehydrogenase n=1 Tax=Robinsoniella peoriensis TaxID=180332 RepID=UPI0005C7D220|nr:2-hydroxyacid dehydrogenase [Robinsoniella peoriensis]